MRVLDVAIGTGLLAREARRAVGAQGEVFGLDVSENMLALARHSSGALLLQADCQAMPIASASMDFICMGYGLRHVSDLGAAFGEFHRILKPGGIVSLLEIGRPEHRLSYIAARIYIGAIVPELAGWLGYHHAKPLLRYYWDTIATCVPPTTILETLRDCGFVAAACATTFGTFREYTARKP
jgi:demethylmenaquinone methyltransferase/2-methoxy-6-polyprenyl-1,4-benzoquinol methylase